MTELLGCPFCGSPARDDLLPHAGGPGWVQCSSCECDQHMSDTLEDAVKRWNTRAPIAAPAPRGEAAPTKSAPVFKAAQDHPESDSAVTLGCAGADTTPPAPDEAVAYVPIHPRNGPLWSDTVPAKSEVHRSNSYERMPLYARPQEPQAGMREVLEVLAALPCTIDCRIGAKQSLTDELIQLARRAIAALQGAKPSADTRAAGLSVTRPERG